MAKLARPVGIELLFLGQHLHDDGGRGHRESQADHRSGGWALNSEQGQAPVSAAAHSGNLKRAQAEDQPAHQPQALSESSRPIMNNSSTTPVGDRPDRAGIAGW